MNCPKCGHKLANRICSICKANALLYPVVFLRSLSNEELTFQIDTTHLERIVSTNATCSAEERDAIFELGKTKLATGSSSEGFKYVQYAAKHWSKPASLLLGYCYDTGLGVKKDAQVAKAYYRQGTLSDPEYQAFYVRGSGTSTELIIAARNAADKMIKAASPSSQFEVMGQIATVDPSSNEARLWNIINENKKPSNEECNAMLTLGRRLLKNGHAADGIRLLKYTAQHGYNFGSLLLGYCYDHGIGVPKDYHVASAYYGRAGVSGGADASYKKYSWDDATHRSRAYRVAESIYNET